MFDFPLDFTGSPAAGTFFFVVLISALVAFVLTDLLKRGLDAFVFDVDSKKRTFILRGSAVLFGAASGMVLGGNLGLWSIAAGVIGGGFSTFIVRLWKKRLKGE